MKTLLLAPELFTTDSGIPRILRLYLKALCDLAGPSDGVNVVTLNDDTIPPRSLARYAKESVLDRVVPCARGRARFVRSALDIGRRSDLLICGHVSQLPVAWLIRRINPRMRYALVAHGIEVWRPFSFLEKLALSGAWRVFCVSEFTRRELLSRVSLSNEVAVVLPNALDPELEHDNASFVRAEVSDRVTILCVSRLSFPDRYKGVDHLIEAMPDVLKFIPSARLRIVGRGDDLQRLQTLAKQHHVDAAVQFTGFVDDEALREEFSRCTVFALPSEKEGFGLVYLEAMTHGKPCIAAEAGGAPEVVSEESGLLVPYARPKALAAACVSALTHPWDTQAIRAWAARFSYSSFRSHLNHLLHA